MEQKNASAADAGCVQPHVWPATTTCPHVGSGRLLFLLKVLIYTIQTYMNKQVWTVASVWPVVSIINVVTCGGGMQQCNLFQFSNGIHLLRKAPIYPCKFSNPAHKPPELEFFRESQPETTQSSGLSNTRFCNEYVYLSQNFSL